MKDYSIQSETLINRFLALDRPDILLDSKEQGECFQELLEKFNLSDFSVTEGENLENNITPELLDSPKIFSEWEMPEQLSLISSNKIENLSNLSVTDFPQLNLQNNGSNFNTVVEEAIILAQNLVQEEEIVNNEEIEEWQELQEDNSEVQNNEYISSVGPSVSSFLNQEFDSEPQGQPDYTPLLEKKLKLDLADNFELPSAKEEILIRSSSLNETFESFDNNIIPGSTIHSPKFVENYKKIENLKLPITVIDQIKVNLDKLTPEDNKITVHLKPQELGSIEIEVNFNKDIIQNIKISVENTDTFHLLRENADNLKTTLASLGLEYGEASLSFNLGQNQQHSQKKFSDEEIKFVYSTDITKQVIANLNSEKSLDIMI